MNAPQDIAQANRVQETQLRGPIQVVLEESGRFRFPNETWTTSTKVPASKEHIWESIERFWSVVDRAAQIEDQNPQQKA